MTDSTKVPGGWLGLWLGILVTAALATALVVAWPDDEERVLAATEPLTPTTRYGIGAVPELPELPGSPGEPAGPAAELFTAGLPEAVAEVLAAAGQPEELQELAIYPSYVFVTYRAGDGLVRSLWRDGTVSLDEPATISPIDLADLFGAGDLDLARIPSLIADAPSRYDEPTTVSHVLIDRFRPFDERVLVRVYAVPTEGSPTSGAGYVSYTADGTVVNVCC